MGPVPGQPRWSLPMSIHNWLTGPWRRFSGMRGRVAAGRRWPRRLEVELLEKRELLSGTNDRFVGQVYRDLLHREADAGALAAWGGLLEHGGSRGDVALGVTRSLEYTGGLAAE